MSQSILFDRIQSLCIEHGVSISGMCKELDISRGSLTNLKMRGTTLSAPALQKIAKYFGMTVDELMSNAEPKDQCALLMSKFRIQLMRFLELADGNIDGATRMLTFAVQELEQAARH